MRALKMAERTGCAVILIGHLNKAQGMKSSQRGLGSIDIRAAVRSVLCVGRHRDDADIRLVVHDKSSLAPQGKSVMFEIGEGCAVSHTGFCDVTVDELFSGYTPKNKTRQAEEFLREILEEKNPAKVVEAKAKELGISKRTLEIAKKNLDVTSERIGNIWYWRLP